MKYDALVIGAGMSGLAAGIRLAQFGRRVAVLERHYLWGGLNSFYKHGGRRIDSGLHALTNFSPPGTRGTPLARVLRQLRIRREELRLGEQRGSRIQLGDCRLRFSNDPSLLETEVTTAFPLAADAYRRLVDDVRAAGFSYGESDRVSAREVLGARLPEPLLVEALLLPVCWYGSARPHDVDWGQFRVIFQSIFLQGLCRPEGGVKTLLDVLIRRLREAGGELRLRAGVARILVEGRSVRGVVLDDGTELEADLVLSSAGLVETRRLAALAPARPEEVGRLSFFETISITDRLPADEGFEDATVFFQLGERMIYDSPADLVDDRSGVVSVPNNFAAAPGGEGQGVEGGQARVTLQANHALWTGLDEPAYAEAKARSAERALDRLAGLGFDPRPFEVDRDTFTPRTIERFTGRVNGAVYGSPEKRLDGDTGVEGLSLCGTDQGYLGVIGAMLSGVTIANRHALTEASA